MKAFILIFAALIVLVTICETRPLVFVAIQNNTLVKSDSEQIGNVVGYLTIRRGSQNFRLRMFGLHSVTSDIKEAWLADSNGTKHASLRIGNDSSAFEGRYIFGDFFLNRTVSDYLLNHKLSVIISTNEYKDGVIGGYFMSKPITGFSIMTGDQVVPPVSTSRGGFAITVIEPAIANSTDIVDNVELIATNSSFGVSIVQTAGVARRASIYGMAGPGVNGVILHNLTHRESRYAFQFGMQTVPADFGVIDGTTYAQIFTPAWPNGAIRGNLEPVLKISRSLGVNQLDVIGGSTSIKPKNLSVLKNAKNVGSSTHTPGTVLGCKTNSTFQYVANFLFRAPVTRRNFALFRGVTLEASLKQNSTATWNFTLFDTDTGNHQTLGIFSGSSDTFVRGLGHYAVTNTSQFITDLRRLVLRVSTTATEPAELIIDQLSLKGHVANGAVSDEVEAVIDNGSILSYKN